MELIRMQDGSTVKATVYTKIDDAGRLYSVADIPGNPLLLRVVDRDVAGSIWGYPTTPQEAQR